MYKNLLFRFNCIKLILFPFSSTSIVSDMKMQCYFEYEIAEEIRTLRKEYIINRMFFFTSVPEKWINSETKKLMFQCDTIPKKAQFNLVFIRYKYAKNSSLLIKLLMKQQLKLLEANET